ncbi:MAG: digeranylgeranylglyceryl phosphate synthase [Candidatus Aenigmatarchaeota archaeon]|nr:MAG: digeranylgeranylglyceryl phosphate synthase [Candidatus Aenigmarchaeota archaeon]
MLSYLELMRPVNCLMAVLAVFIGEILVIRWNGSLFLEQALYFGLIAVFLIAGAGNAINDYKDFEADKINRPERPIPSGRIKRSSALIFSILLFVLGTVLAAFINWMAFGIAVINSLLLILYTYYFQDKMFVGNFIISYLVGSTFLFGNVVMGDYRLGFVLMFLAGLSNFSREIIKDLEDIEGDKQSFLKKITSKVGSIAERFRITPKGVKLKYRKRYALFISEFSLVLAVFFSPLPFLTGILGYSYMVVVGFADLIFMWCVWKMFTYKQKQDLAKISKNIKAGMFFGLLAFLAGALL